VKIKLNTVLAILFIFMVFLGCGKDEGSTDSAMSQDEALTLISDLAESGDASSLTIEILETAGVTGLNGNYLEGYQNAVANAGSIPDLSALQSLIDSVSAPARYDTSKYNQAYFN
jgi:hypothetical protein